MKEFEVVDGYPILDEFEPLTMDHPANNSEQAMQLINSDKKKAYSIEFRLPLRGISEKLISPTLLNVCNMFSTLYFLQLVIVMKSLSINVPGKKKSKDGVQIIES